MKLHTRPSITCAVERRIYEETIVSAGMSTFAVTAIWALPIAIAVILMAIYYRSPSEEELRECDEMQPDEKPSTAVEPARTSER